MLRVDHKSAPGDKSTPVQQNRMKAKDTKPGTRHVAPLKWPTDPRPQFKPQVVQSKSRAVAPVTSVSFGRERKSPPITLLAYRPQPVPKVLQLKRHQVKKLGGIAQPQNAVRSPFIPQAPQKALPKNANLSRPEVHQHQAATSNRAAQSPEHPKPRCVQAKTSSSLPNNPLAWSVRKPPSGNVVGPGRSIQLAAAAPKKMEAVEVEAKAEVKKPANLSALAKMLHAAGGGTGQNTTGVARLKNGKLVACTQLSVATIKAHPAAAEVDDVTKTKGAGFHCEVSLFIDYSDDIVAVGASQGFCPHCQKFLKAKGIAMEGVPRATNDQVWYSPEFYFKVEKNPKSAPYPWAYELEPVERTRVTYKTMAIFVAKYKKLTDGEYPPWFKEL